MITFKVKIRMLPLIMERNMFPDNFDHKLGSQNLFGFFEALIFIQNLKKENYLDSLKGHYLSYQMMN